MADIDRIKRRLIHYFYGFGQRNGEGKPLLTTARQVRRHARRVHQGWRLGINVRNVIDRGFFPPWRRRSQRVRH